MSAETTNTLDPASNTVTNIASKIIVWSKPDCQQCEATKRYLNKRAVPYELRNLLDHPAQIEKFRQMNLMTAPIVETLTDIWSGFRPDRLSAVIAELELDAEVA